MPVINPTIHDTEILSTSATTNFGTAATIRVISAAVMAGTARRQGIVAISLAGIAAGSTINSATLTLKVISEVIVTSGGYQVRRIIRPSILADGSLLNSQTTHNNATTIDAWGTPGALNTTTDVTTVGELSTALRAEVDLVLNLAAMAQAALDEGSAWLVIIIEAFLSGGVSDDVTFHSVNAASAGDRPTCPLDYTPPDTTDPVITLESIDDADEVDPDEWHTSDDEVTLHGTATDPGSPSTGITEVTVTNDQGFSEVVPVVAGEWEVTVPITPVNVPHVFTITGEDSATPTPLQADPVIFTVIHAKRISSQYASMRRIEIGPIIHTDGDGGPLIAAKFNRISDTIIELSYPLLDPTELAALMEIWEDGVGLVRHFRIRLPDEADDRLVLFADASFAAAFRNPVWRSIETVRLIDVTPAGFFA